MARPLFFAPEGDAWRCGLCPHRCLIRDGGAGRCRVRRVEEGRPSLPFWGKLSAASIDPMEKKPLYHFLPGASVYSVGFVGCNLSCPFCQNWEISQSADAETVPVPPAALVDRVLKSGCPAVAYTYSEPLAHIEYLLEAMKLSRRAGLANVLVSNGCASEEAARAVLPLCDAANIDLKSSNESKYANVLGGNAAAVKRFIALAHESGTHLEVTTLVVTGFNDDAGDVLGCAGFLAEISPDIPFHLSAYRPAYRWREAPTDGAFVLGLAEAARRRLRYVYAGNIPGETNDTRCPACGTTAIARRGYRTDASGLSVGDDGSARCRACGERVPIILGRSAEEHESGRDHQEQAT